MVTFKANVYHEDNDNLIGAEVIVYDGDTPIDSILITSKSSYDELVEEIASLSSRFVSFREQSELSEKTIEEILENSENEIGINASLLNGHTPNYYAKASHAHIMSQISDLKTYEISLSNYNPIIGYGTPATTTATVTVKNSAGAPAANEQVILSIDGTLHNGTTNSSGTFSMNFSTYDVGIHTFAVKNQKVQCLVEQDTGWVKLNLNPDFKPFSSGHDLKFKVKNGLVHINGILTPNRNWSTTEDKTVAIMPNGFRPAFKQSALMQGSDRDKFLLMVEPDGKITVNRYGPVSNNSWSVGMWLHMYITYLL
ncbi:hypothetical protein [Methanobrevibacter sp.]|uniref:hypothetical protein n=1 Tax=Methanobrevibacter sp. TaxID=66852 RepID=UPI00388E9AA2